jgi:hypothetical protein
VKIASGRLRLGCGGVAFHVTFPGGRRARPPAA